MELENDLAVRALHALGVEPSPEQIASVVGGRGNETLEAYKMFNEAFGGDQGTPAAAPAPGRRDTPGVPAAGKRTSWLSFASDAWAGTDDVEVGAIQGLFARYAAALSARDVEQVVLVQPSLTPDARKSLTMYFEHARDLQVQISDLDILNEGDEAVVEYHRRDRFVDTASGRRQELEYRLSARLRRQPDGAWVITALGS
jgi:ketosteroid isomerase-like protein